MIERMPRRLGRRGVRALSASTRLVCNKPGPKSGQGAEVLRRARQNFYWLWVDFIDADPRPEGRPWPKASQVKNERSQHDKEAGNPPQPDEEWDPVEEGRLEQLAWRQERERQRRPVAIPKPSSTQPGSDQQSGAPSGDPIMDIALPGKKKSDPNPLGVSLGDLLLMLQPTSINASLEGGKLIARHEQYTTCIEVVLPESCVSERGPIRAVVRMTTELPQQTVELLKEPEAIEARAAQDYDARLNPQDAPWATDGAEIARRATEGVLRISASHCWLVNSMQVALSETLSSAPEGFSFDYAVASSGVSVPGPIAGAGLPGLKRPRCIA
jgi:hypothetical protein